MKPELSVIIPCYNCEDTLEEAVDSVYASTLNVSFEVVIVNDASTDGTSAVIERLAKKYSGLRHLSNPSNLGGGATRNKAVEASLGELIFCLDSDDLLAPDTLPRLVDYQRQKHSDGVGISTSIKFRGTDKENIAFINYFGYVGETIPFESLLQYDDVFCPLYSTFLITRKAFDRIGGYPTAHGFDTQGIAWRFLAAGLTAYTCPDTIYYHRIQFHDSYYVRESNAGKANYNWQDIFFEHFNLFDDSTQEFIRTFNCKDFSKNIFDEIKKRDRVFRPGYEALLGTKTSKSVLSRERVYIRRNSPYGILLRLREKAKHHPLIRPLALYCYLLIRRFYALLTEGKTRTRYYESLGKIKEKKEIVVDIEHGGIGDWLVYSSLPRLLAETYGINFYISQASIDRLRNKDTAKLCFEYNPYFKGFKDSADTYAYRSFEREKSLPTFFTDRGGKSIVEKLEDQWNVNGRGVPELHYKPQMLEQYRKTMLVDTNTISGRRFGWRFKTNAFKLEAERHLEPGDRIEQVDPKRQDLFRYVDMIYSCKRFVGTFSGGASIAACFDKPFSVIWPVNGKNMSNYQFVYRKSQGEYVE